MHMQLFRGLDHAGQLERLLGVEQLDARVGEVLRTPRFAAVDGEAQIAAAVPAHQVDHVGRHRLGLLGGARSGQEVEPRHAGAHLVDRIEPLAEVPAGAVLEQHHRAVDGHEHVTAGGVQRPHAACCVIRWRSGC